MTWSGTAHLTPDVNVPLAAFRPGHVHHRVASGWLVDAVNVARTLQRSCMRTSHGAQRVVAPEPKQQSGQHDCRETQREPPSQCRNRFIAERDDGQARDIAARATTRCPVAPLLPSATPSRCAAESAPSWRRADRRRRRPACNNGVVEVMPRKVPTCSGTALRTPTNGHEEPMTG